MQTLPRANLPKQAYDGFSCYRIGVTHHRHPIRRFYPSFIRRIRQQKTEDKLPYFLSNQLCSSLLSQLLVDISRDSTCILFLRDLDLLCRQGRFRCRNCFTTCPS